MLNPPPPKKRRSRLYTEWFSSYTFSTACKNCMFEYLFTCICIYVYVFIYIYIYVMDIYVYIYDTYGLTLFEQPVTFVCF